MRKNNGFTKSLAIAGTLLVWFPLVMPVIGVVQELARSGSIGNFDWLMPAELFPAVLVGTVLLLWASLRTHDRRKPMWWGVGLLIGVPVAGTAFARLSGLATGEREFGDWAGWVLLGMIVVYVLTIVEIGVVGITLIVDLFRNGRSTAEAPPAVPAM